MRSSIVISALVAVLIGFGGSVAIILAAAKSVGASVDQTSSWVAVLCVSMMATTGVLSIRHRMPLVTAWSTPGAALIAASSGVTLEAAVGAFVLAALLILLTALLRPLNDLVERIPVSVASAMLAGVLFSFVADVVAQMQLEPWLVLPLVILFLVLRLFSPAWAVLISIVFGVGLAFGLGLVGPIGELRLSAFVWVNPQFNPTVLIGIGIPLYLVTMASQNLPGFAVLRSDGYQPPTRSILAVTGLASLASAGFAGHTTSLSSITASICTGEDAHPDPAKRWLCGVVYAAGYAVLAVFGASLVTILTAFPEALIVAIAGIALAGPFVASLSASLAGDEQFTAAATFIVTASGVSAFGLGSAFWGLVAGLAVLMLSRMKAAATA